MTPLATLRTLLYVLLLGCFLSVSLLAQEAGETIQPRVTVYLPEAEGAPPNAIALTQRINSDLLRRLNDRNRFALTVEAAPEDLESFVASLSTDPPEEVAVVVAGVLDERRDGSYRYLFDVWSSKLERVVFSQEFDARGLPMMGNEDAIDLLSREIRAEVESAVLRLFPGFGWLLFDNRGVDDTYEVLINDKSMGNNLQEISLLPGEWRIEVIQEIDGRIYTMARDSVALAVEDYYRLIFSLADEPPEIPGYLRLERTRDDWGVGVEFEYDYLFPIMEASEELFNGGSVGMSRVVWNDVPAQNLVFGIDFGVGSFSASEEAAGEYDSWFFPLFGFLGYRVGPLQGVDFTVKAAGGVFYSVTEYETTDPGSGEQTTETEDDIIPAGRFSMEFGFNWGRSGRFFGGASYWGAYEDEKLFSFVGLHGGVGVKF